MPCVSSKLLACMYMSHVMSQHIHYTALPVIQGGCANKSWRPKCIHGHSNEYLSYNSVPMW